MPFYTFLRSLAEVVFPQVVVNPDASARKIGTEDDLFAFPIELFVLIGVFKDHPIIKGQTIARIAYTRIVFPGASIRLYAAAVYINLQERGIWKERDGLDATTVHAGVGADIVVFRAQLEEQEGGEMRYGCEQLTVPVP